MRIAIYGGSFDPIHIAHEKIVLEALKNLNLDLLILLPTYLNPHKIHSHLEPSERLFILSKNFDNFSKVLVSDFEVSKNRAVHSIESIRYFKNYYKPEKTYLIIGADNYQSFSTWHKSKEILEEVELVVATRNGYLNQNYDNIKTLNINIDISSTKLRDKLDLKFVPKKIQEDVKKLWH